MPLHSPRRGRRSRIGFRQILRMRSICAPNWAPRTPGQTHTYARRAGIFHLDKRKIGIVVDEFDRAVVERVFIVLAHADVARIRHAVRASENAPGRNHDAEASTCARAIRPRAEDIRLRRRNLQLDDRVRRIYSPPLPYAASASRPIVWVSLAPCKTFMPSQFLPMSNASDLLQNFQCT